MTATTLEPAGSPASQPTTATSNARAARRAWRLPIALGVLGVLAVVLFGLLPAGGRDTTFGLSTSSDFVHLGPVTVPSKATALVLSVLALALAAYAGWCVSRARRVGRWVPILFAVLWVLAFLTWAVAGKSTSLVSLLAGSLFLAVPLAFGALGGLIGERAGVVNIAIEGQLLTGAFGAAVFASIVSNAYLGLVAAPVAGLLIGALLALFTVKYHVNQIIVGVVLNVFAVGLTRTPWAST
jgi:simple sugar transport system permease protein